MSTQPVTAVVENLVYKMFVRIKFERPHYSLETLIKAFGPSAVEMNDRFNAEFALMLLEAAELLDKEIGGRAEPGAVSSVEATESGASPAYSNTGAPLNQDSCEVQADREDTNTKCKRSGLSFETGPYRPLTDALVAQESSPLTGLLADCEQAVLNAERKRGN